MNIKINTRVNTMVNTRVNIKINTRVNTMVNTRVDIKINRRVNIKINTRINVTKQTVHTKIHESFKMLGSSLPSLVHNRTGSQHKTRLDCTVIRTILHCTAVDIGK